MYHLKKVICLLKPCVLVRILYIEDYSLVKICFFDIELKLILFAKISVELCLLCDSIFETQSNE